MSTVPGPAQLTEDSYIAAKRRGSDFARHAQVDVWYSEDRTHFTRVARCRRPLEDGTDADEQPDRAETLE